MRKLHKLMCVCVLGVIALLIGTSDKIHGAVCYWVGNNMCNYQGVTASSCIGLAPQAKCEVNVERKLKTVDGIKQIPAGGLNGYIDDPNAPCVLVDACSWVADPKTLESSCQPSGNPKSNGNTADGVIISGQDCPCDA